MATNTLTYTGTLKIVTCWCGIAHAVPVDLFDRMNRQHRDGQEQMGIFCPLGHSWVFAGDGDATRLRAQLDQMKASRDAAWTQAERARERADRINRSNAALRGHLTRWRKRVANGVCPVAGCHRHFPNVQAHVATQHGDWLAEHPEVFEAASE